MPVNNCRPFVDIDLSLGPYDPPPITVTESLAKFKTMAFGIEFLRDIITIVTGEHGYPVVDYWTWLFWVPECYRDNVWPVYVRVHNKFVGEHLTKPLLERLCYDLSGAINEEIEPIV